MSRLEKSPSTGAESFLRRRHLPWLLVTALLIFSVVRSAWLCDDAFITFRTADNFIHGYGLTWNVAERVQTYTHPLWLFLFFRRLLRHARAVLHGHFSFDRRFRGRCGDVWLEDRPLGRQRGDGHFNTGVVGRFCRLLDLWAGKSTHASAAGVFFCGFT